MSGAVTRLAALGLVGVTAALCAASCAAVIGVEAPENVAEELCGCESVKTLRNQLSGPDADQFNCESKIENALEQDDKLAKNWLETYEKNCKCGDIDDLRSCLKHDVFCKCDGTLEGNALGPACALICPSPM